MSSSGTLIGDLDSSPQLDGDGDLISKIMADMNIEPSPAQQQQQPSGGVISAPNPNSTLQHTMDKGPPTAHVIGHSHPTQADFQAALSPQGLPSASSLGGSAAWVPAANAGARLPPRRVPKKSWWNKIFDEMKLPIFVALIVFLFSLPVVNLIIGTYIPSFVKGTGELTAMGLLLKSLAAGGTFWLLQRVVVPLLSL
jgi:hypothetical protein